MRISKILVLIAAGSGLILCGGCSFKDRTGNYLKAETVKPLKRSKNVNLAPRSKRYNINDVQSTGGLEPSLLPPDFSK